MFVKSHLQFDRCIRPVARRLALFQENDEYECYAERYVKCFWGLCDHHKSNDNFAATSDCHVVTQQPQRQQMPFRNPIAIKDIIVSS